MRDAAVTQRLRAAGCACETFNADLLYEPWEVFHADGAAFTSFDAFWLKAMSMLYEPDLPCLSPKGLPPVPEALELASEALENLCLMSPEEAPSNDILSRKCAPAPAQPRSRCCRPCWC